MTFSLRRKNKADIKVFAVAFVFILVLFPGNFSLAQTTPSSGSSVENLQTLIAKLRKEIEALKAQITRIQDKAKTAKEETKAVKKELGEVKEELRLTVTLRKGERGEAVKKLQAFLKQLPDDVYPEGLVTGYFGSWTERAVQRFQEKQGIVKGGDSQVAGFGQVGPETLRRINELMAEGAGVSGVTPPGLLTAPGIQKPAEVPVAVPPTSATSTPPIITPPTGATSTPPVIPPITPWTPAPLPPPSTGTTTPSVPGATTALTTPPPPPPSGPTSFYFNVWSPTTVSAGGSATVSWNTSGYPSCYAGVNRGDVAAIGWLGVKPASGSQTISPLNYQNIDVQFTCTGGTPEISSSKVVTVSNGTSNPWSNISTFKVTNHPLDGSACCTYLIPANTAVNVSWSGSSPTACKLHSQILEDNTLTPLATNLPASGSYTISSITQTTRLWLTCGGVDSSRLLKVQGSEPPPSPPPPAPPPPSSGDTEAPPTPTGLTATPAQQSVALSWSAGGADVAGYNVYRSCVSGTTCISEAKIISSTSLLTSAGKVFTADVGLNPGSTYSYTVAAFDAAGNVSAQSSPVSGTTLSGTIIVPQVQGVTATVSGASVLLSWQSTPNAYSYAIHRGTSADFTPASYNSIYFGEGKYLSYTDTNLANQTYYYKVRGYSVGGIVGAASDAVSVTVGSSTSPSSVSSLPAPTASTVGGSVTTSGDPYQVGVYAMLVDFVYDPNNLSKVKSFRFYQKRPGDAGFSLTETFSDPGAVASCYAGSGVRDGSVWKLLYLCSSPNNIWRIQMKTRQPASYYAIGDHEFYVTAVDALGIESSPSPVFKITILPPTEVTAPTQAQAPVSDKPSFQWTTGGSYADIYIYEEAYLTAPSPIIYVKRVYGTSYLYDGPTLDSSKKYVVHMQGEGRSSGYTFTTSMTKNIETFWVSAPVACTESWSCDTWSSCANSTQTRTCADANNCGTTNSRPALSQSCTVATTSCTDSDAGLNKETQGTVSGYYPYENSNRTFTDYCRSVNSDGSDPNWLQEYLCYPANVENYTPVYGSTGVYITQGSYYCASGCQNGACLPSSPSGLSKELLLTNILSNLSRLIEEVQSLLNSVSVR